MLFKTNTTELFFLANTDVFYVVKEALQLSRWQLDEEEANSNSM